MPQKKAPVKRAPAKPTVGPSSFIVRSLSASGKVGVDLAMKHYRAGSTSAAVSALLNGFPALMEELQAKRDQLQSILDDLNDIQEEEEQADKSTKAASLILGRLFAAAKAAQSDRYRRRLAR